MFRLILGSGVLLALLFALNKFDTVYRVEPLNAVKQNLANKTEESRFCNATLLTLAKQLNSAEENLSSCKADTNAISAQCAINSILGGKHETIHLNIADGNYSRVY